MVQIRNVKVSVSIKYSPLSNAINSLKQLGITFKQFPNFISFNNKFTFIYFKEKSIGDKKVNHINVTKLKSLCDVIEVKQIILDLFNCEIIKSKIDNIIATADINHKLDLRTLISENKFVNIKYNFEQFPGLFVKFPSGTAIVFHSGKVVLVGFKDIRDLTCTLNQITVATLQ